MIIPLRTGAKNTTRLSNKVVTVGRDISTPFEETKAEVMEV